MAEVLVQTNVRLKTTICYSCGALFGMEAAFFDYRVNDKTRFYCPNGHGQSFTGTPIEEELATARLQRDAARQQEERAWAALQETQDLLNAEKKARKAEQKRAQNGVCLHCHRSFANVKRHVQSRHPEAVPA